MTKSLLLTNILLALVWVAATGTLTQENFLFGFLISFGVLWIITVRSTQNKYFILMPKFIFLVLYVIYEIILANFQTARDSLYPKSKLSPAIVKLPLTAKSDLEITLLANLIALTPGSMVIDTSDDRKVMYIHVMHMTDKKKLIDNIKNNFERRLLEIMR